MTEESNTTLGSKILKATVVVGVGLAYLKFRQVSQEAKKLKKLDAVLKNINDDLTIKLDDPDFELMTYEAQVKTDKMFYQIIKDQ